MIPAPRTNLSAYFFRDEYSSHDFEIPEEIVDWDTSAVTRMRQLFAASPIVQEGGFWNPMNLDIAGWDTSSVTSMHGMFRQASAFNQDIGG